MLRIPAQDKGRKECPASVENRAILRNGVTGGAPERTLPEFGWHRRGDEWTKVLVDKELDGAYPLKRGTGTSPVPPKAKDPSVELFSTRWVFP